MKTVEIIGYKRANLGKSDSQRLREEGNVPCVLYGTGPQIHFHAPMILFRDLVYTNEAHFVHPNIEVDECQSRLQEIQLQPVSEIIMHADFVCITVGRKIRMRSPTRIVGQALGVVNGGTVVRMNDSRIVVANPRDMPYHMDGDVS